MGYVGKKPTAAPLTASDVTDGIITTAKIADDAVTTAKAAFSPGKVLQVVSTTKTDTFSGTSTSFADVTGLSVAITPSSTSNKVFITANFVVSNGSGARSMYFNLLRGSTDIAQPDTPDTNDCTIQCNTQVASSGIEVAKISFLDTPSTTSATTYKIQYKQDSGTTYVGRRGDSDQRSVSTITAYEIAG